MEIHIMDTTLAKLYDRLEQNYILILDFNYRNVSQTVYKCKENVLYNKNIFIHSN